MPQLGTHFLFLLQKLLKEAFGQLTVRKHYYQADTVHDFFLGAGHQIKLLQ